MKNYNTEIMELEGVISKKIEIGEKVIKLYVEEPRKIHKCGCCGELTDKVHDYYLRTIKDVPIRGKQVLILYNRRRYKCTHCGKNITEETKLIGKYSRISKKLVETVIERLKDIVSFKQVAKENNISTTSVMRFFDYVSYRFAGFTSNVLCIDEFKGNVDGNKYQAVLVDPVNQKVIQVYNKRLKYYLQEQFLSIPRAERAKIKYFITDMWETYIDLGERLFPNATIVIDRFHYVRIFTEAMHRVRKRIQETYGDEIRKYFKHSRRLLLCRKDKLTAERDKEQLQEMLSLSGQLRVAYDILQKFYEFSQSKTESEARKQLKDVYDIVECSNLEEFKEALRTITKYQRYILNSFKTKYTNAYAEGQNNVTKVMKRVGFGYRNGKRFIQRILHHAA